MSTGESGSKEVVHPQTIRVGDRTIPIDSSPLPLRRRKENLAVRWGGIPRVVQPDAHSLVIGLSAGRYGCLLLTVPLGIVGTLFFGTAAAFPSLRPQLLPLVGDTISTWPLVLLAGLFLLWLLFWNIPTHVSSLFGGCRVRFDRAAGVMMFGPIWDQRSRPLSDIVAVQLVTQNLLSEFNLPPAQFGEDSQKFDVKFYQMNLVLDNADTPRLSVASYRDQTQAHQAGQQLAEFLGIPLVDQIEATKQPAAAGPPAGPPPVVPGA
jgi:hypothetical protein